MPTTTVTVEPGLARVEPDASPNKPTSWSSQESLSHTVSNTEYTEAYQRLYDVPHDPQPRERGRREALANAVKGGGAWSVPTLLCVDGGGIRGLSSLLVLEALMRSISVVETSTWPPALTSGDSPLLDATQVSEEMSKLKQQLPKHQKDQHNHDDFAIESNYLPCHYFDWIAGTSTGGLIATMLGRLWMSVDHTMREFKALTSEVYGLRYRSRAKRLKYIIFRDKSHEELKVKALVSDYFGERPLLLPSATAQDRCKTLVCSFETGSGKGNRTPYLFRSYDYGPSDSVYTVASVMGATSCSPYYFTPVKLGSKKFCDAGLSWPNPTGEACREVFPQHRTMESKGFVLSIGCGYDTNIAANPRSSRKFWHQTQSRMARTTVLVNSSLAAISEDVHKYMEATKDELSIEYHRFNATLDLSTIDTQHIHSWKAEVDELQSTILKRTRAYLSKDHIQEQLKQCAEILVDLRRRRSRTAIWEAFAFGVRYRCKTEEQCESKNLLFDRSELKHHLQETHVVDDGEDETNIKTLLERGRTRSDDFKNRS